MGVYIDVMCLRHGGSGLRGLCATKTSTSNASSLHPPIRRPEQVVCREGCRYAGQRRDGPGNIPHISRHKDLDMENTYTPDDLQGATR
jgi:hypothetical protein